MHFSSFSRMRSIQRRAALRICSAYRTVSEPAALLIAGVMPIRLQALERSRIFAARQGSSRDAERSRSLALRQNEWDAERRGEWTRRILPSIKTWISRTHGEVNYYLTQFLSGHGYFFAFLFRLRKVPSPKCPYGDSENDTAFHTFFECRNWERERELY